MLKLKTYCSTLQLILYFYLQYLLNDWGLCLTLVYSILETLEVEFVLKSHQFPFVNLTPLRFQRTSSSINPISVTQVLVQIKHQKVQVIRWSLKFQGFVVKFSSSEFFIYQKQAASCFSQLFQKQKQNLSLGEYCPLVLENKHLTEKNILIGFLVKNKQSKNAILEGRYLSQ